MQSPQHDAMYWLLPCMVLAWQASDMMPEQPAVRPEDSRKEGFLGVKKIWGGGGGGGLAQQHGHINYARMAIAVSSDLSKMLLGNMVDAGRLVVQNFGNHVCAMFINQLGRTDLLHETPLP